MSDDVTVDNGANPDFVVDTTQLGGTNAEVQHIQLVTATTGDAAAVKLAQLIGEAYAAGLFALAWGVRKDTAAALSGVADGDKTVPIFDALNQLYVNVGSMPGAARTTDTISAAVATDAIMNNLTALTPKFAVIDAATSGDNTIVAAVTSKKIRVHQLFVVSASARTIRFESGAGGTALTGQMNVAANGGFVLPFSPAGWFETASGVLLNMELDGATTVDGSILYTEV